MFAFSMSKIKCIFLNGTIYVVAKSYLNKSITDHLANHLPIATVFRLGNIENGKTFP